MIEVLFIWYFIFHLCTLCTLIDGHYIMVSNRNSDTKKDKDLHIKCTEQEREELKKLAHERYMSMSRFIMEAVRDYIRNKT